MNSKARIFLALDVDISVAEKLVLLQQDLAPILSKRDASAAWIAPEKLHLTLKFVGDIERALIPRVRDKIDQVCKNTLAFSFATQGVLAFPDGTRPRIIAARALDPNQKLASLVAALNEALGELGIETESKPFLPHITVGRVKTPKAPVDLTDVLEAVADLKIGTSAAQEIVIYESHLTPKGAQYQVLSRRPLKAAKDG